MSKLKLNPITGQLDVVPDSGDLVQKLNPVTGEFNLTTQADGYNQVLNPISWELNLYPSSQEPSPYEIMEAYVCTGNSVIDLWIKPTDDMSVELHYSVYHNGSLYVFWTRLVDWWNQLLTFSWGQTGWTVTFFVKWVWIAAKTWGTNWARVYWENNEYIWKITITPTQKKIYAKDIINNREFNDTGMNSWSFSSDVPNLKAWGNGRDYETSWTKIYDIKITQTIDWVTKKYHFVPAKRIADGVVWFYERHSKQFYS